MAEFRITVDLYDVDGWQADDMADVFHAALGTLAATGGAYRLRVRKKGDPADA